MRGYRVVFVLAAVLVLVSGVLPAGCSSNRGFDAQLKAAARPYRFSVINWEFQALGREVRGLFEDIEEDVQLTTGDVLAYFDNAALIRGMESDIGRIITEKRGDTLLMEAGLAELRVENAAVNDGIEALLEKQIREALSGQGIYNPVTSGNTGFPPVNFELAKLPYLLIVSPRDRIESIREVVLLPEMTVEEMESLEEQVDALGVSSVVEPLGGLATYPSLVMEGGGLRFVLNAATEEWLHVYLAFKPLGFRYVLDLTGLRRNYEIATMNETVVGIVSKEIGAIIYDEYYAADAPVTAVPDVPVNSFDYFGEMRITRQNVDEYLARGEVEEAEAYMEERRQYIADNGYYIRKLNQAYFAFHGAYADRPDSVSPIGAELRELRDNSGSLKEFLETAAAMTSRQDLIAALGN